MIAMSGSTRPVRTRTNCEWLTELRGHGPARQRALTDLRTHLARAVLLYLSHHPGAVQDLDRCALQRLVENCTAEVLSDIDEKLDTFRDASRFTTWANSLAVRHIATAVRYSRVSQTSPMPSNSR